ncbi:MAG: phage tail tape measure protein [Myxococcales bacterium]|nr:phage tail tape measure protein [Myxococcales bacterium]
MSRVRARLEFDTSGFRRGARKVNAASAQMRQKSGRAFKGMAAPLAALTAGVVGFAAAMKGVRFGIGTIADYGAEMSQVKGITQASTQEMTNAGLVVRKLASITKFTAAETSAALAELARGGLDIQSALKTLPAVLDGAAAGNMDVKDTAQQLIGVYNVFKKQGYNAAASIDIITKASNSSATSMQDLLQAFRYTNATASLTSTSLEEVAAMMGVLADNGLQADMAGAGLRNVMLKASQTSSTFSKEMKKLGVSHDEINPKIVGVAGAMQKIIDTKGAKDIMTELFQARTVTAAATLVDNMDAYNEKLETLRNSTGEAQRMQEAMMDNLKGDWLKLKSMVSEAWLSAPIQDFLRGVVKSLTDAAAQVANAFKVMKQVTGDGNLGKALGLSLKVGFKESVNFFQRLMTASFQTIGPLLSAVITMAIARFKLLTDPDFWKGMGHALLGIAAQFAAIMHDVLAGIFDAIAKLPGKLGDIAEIAAADTRRDGDFLKQGAVDSFRRAGAAFDEPIGEFTDKLMGEIQKVSSAFSTNFRNSRGFLDSSKDKEELARVFAQAQGAVNDRLAKAPGREAAVKPGAPNRVLPSASAAVEQGFSSVGAIAGAINVIFGRSVNANILEVNKNQLKTQKSMDNKLANINEGIQNLNSGSGELVFAGNI